MNTIPGPMRLLVALALGALAGFASYGNAAASTFPRDFSQIWYAAGAMLRDVNPYLLIGPGLPFNWPNPFLYPLPAAVLALPLTPFPEAVACGVFMFVAAAALAWALMEHGYVPLIGLASTSMLFATEVVQWSPLLASAVVIPAAGLVFAAKPTIGAAIFVARPSWWPIMGGVALVALAFAFDPAWVSHWREALAWNATIKPPAAPYRAPVTLPGGVLALLALLRWRRPEARLIAALACVPHTLLMYESVPLLLVPRRRSEVALFVALSWGVWWWRKSHPIPSDYVAHLHATGTMMVWLLYLPCVLMVLHRPNEGAAPAWMEPRTALLPAWLRGSAPHV